MAQQPIRVLVADDEANFRRILSKELARKGHAILTAENGAEALEKLRADAADVVVLDLNMPGLGGIEVLRELADRPDRPEVIVATGYASVSTAIEAMKLGAYDYLTKPCKIEKLDLLIRKAHERRALAAQNAALRSGIARVQGHPPGIVFQSARMAEVIRMVDRVAATDSTVLVMGESGTGKELVARELHDRSPRREDPFVPIHCGALPRDLLESELFGHEKGAFTGAVSQKLGLFEVADKGTLFLDEIGETPAESQVKLLRVLETGSFFRVGGTRPRTVDVRVVAATNQDLKAAVEAGRFRQDLFYRINTVSISLPALRERPEDIPLLTQHFLEANAGLGRKALSRAALEAMRRYAWPGNVRELQHVIQRSLILSAGDEIAASDLPLDLRAGEQIPPAAPRSLDELERQHIIGILRQVGGQRGKAAAILGIDPKTLYRKIHAFGITPESYRS